MKRKIALASFVVLACMFAVAQQKQRQSPPGTAEFTFQDGKKVQITYHRPSMRGRKIYGGLVPFNQVWRTGANEATTLKTDVALDINGTQVPAGAYTLFTLPSEGTWKLIVNKQTGQWGTDYKQDQDLARIDMQKEALPEPAEQFTISFEPEKGSTTQLNLDWEDTRQSVTVTAAK
ncbi:MAG TPA: DUF2911 domain-containing protein [Clostridia bacterium]|nr:DUF2911 domain-containing protein [Clostridia bacterium]